MQCGVPTGISLWLRTMVVCAFLYFIAHDVFIARLRTVEMRLISPIAIDAQLPKEIGGGRSGSTLALLIPCRSETRRQITAVTTCLNVKERHPPRRWKWPSGRGYV